MKSKLLLLWMVLFQQHIYANTADQWMRSGLKYPVVLGVLFCIFIGIAAILLMLEKRVKKLENK